MRFITSAARPLSAALILANSLLLAACVDDGDSGSDGAMGEQGEPGPQGAEGPQGPVGPAGAQGAQGPQGAAGLPGPVGAAGAQGAQGPIGPAGSNGSDGSTGAAGARGPAGEQGVAGPTGPQGPTGPAGSLTLPFTATQSAAAALFSLSNTGSGNAIVGIGNTGFGVQGITSQQSSAGVVADNTGGGEAMVGRTTSDIAGAVVGRNDGGGSGVRGFIASDTSGTGVGVLGQVGSGNSTGRAGRFENNNAANESNAFEVVSKGLGNIPDNTQGNAGSFVVDNTQSVGAAVRGEVNTIFGNLGAAGIFGVSSGTGGFAGLFHAGNPNGNGAALVAIADGNGNGITTNAGKDGDGIEATVDGTGTAVYGWVPNFGIGQAGRFQNYNPANTTPVIRVETVGTNNLAVFRAGAANVARIDAAGKGFFNGGVQANGADIAELIPTVGEEPQIGDVVEIDPMHEDRFRLSSSANTTRVAGVISTQPGVTLNARNGAHEDAVGPALALVGRVPVKVTGENGPIRIGDLLVASSKAGHAMRAPEHPAPGTVIGKALKRFDERTGQVEMLVMLR
ncbi:collagen triple helix repeat protein [Panacagrimonas perspica]|uniref:Collagen triple helix repeat protein n=1 Tax=Panacagrimonas perspica TaxID=381431 RepID=A0A4R7PAL1_9GAMM|nr:collagen-like protein [Panacagrimonas perspica]TDU31074.1 collagen triple helix repeat protein [Panacagrimonas perspica]THD01784.1 hypothetical protein B1810_17405 [Panacagrimonas perspica]